MTIMTCYILLLTLTIATFLPLIGFFLVRSGVLGVFKISILDESRHKLSHVIVVTFKPPQLLLEGCKVTILLEN